MRIESLCRRPPKGTVVEIEGKNYEFKPDPETGREFCDIANPHHADILLAIPEGYRSVDGAKPPHKSEYHQKPPAREPEIEHDHEPKVAAVDDGLEDLSRNELAGVYASEVGRAPSSAMSKAELIKAIRKARDA